MAASNFAALGIAALVPLLRGDLGLSTAGVGLIASTLFLAAALTTFAGGALTDRVGPGAALAAAHLIAAFGVGVAATAHAAAVFYAGIALIGVGYGLLNPATNVLASEGIDRSRRGLAMSIKQTGATIGGAAGALALPPIAAVAGWRSAMALPIVTCGIVAGWGLRAHVPASARRPGGGGRAGGRPRLHRRLAIYGFAMAGVQIAIFGYITVYLVDEKSFTPVLAGAAVSVALMAGTVGRLLLGAVSDRLAHRRAACLIWAAAGAGASLVLLVTAPPWAVWPVLALLGFCAAGWNGVFHTIVAESAAPESAGRVSAVALFFVYAGSIATPPALGVLADGGEAWSLAWIAVAAVAVVAASSVATGSSAAGAVQ